MPLPPSPVSPKIKRNFLIFATVAIAGFLALAGLIISMIKTAVQPTSKSGSATNVAYDMAGTSGADIAMEESSYSPRTSLAQKTVTLGAMPAAAPAPMDATGNGSGAGETGPRIIRNGNLTLRVQDAQTALDQAKAIAAGKGGFVQSSSISDPGNGPRTGYVTIRVPVVSFDAAIGELKKIAAVVLEESTNASDVTMQYTDLESNLRNARAEEQSYLDLLKRSGSMNDTLSVTRALADVRGRIEQLEGQKRYMESQTDDATIFATLTEEARIEAPTRTWKPLEVIRQALSDLIRSLQGLVDVLIRLVVSFIGLFIPIALIVALFIWLGWKVVAAITKRMFKPRI